jgi:hypothetical protein
MTLLPPRIDSALAPRGVRVAAGLLALTLVGFALPETLAAQAPAGDTVSWTVSTSTETSKPGSRLTVTLHGAVQEGWHVYALKQLPEGPTPLSVAIDTNSVAKAAGAATGSAPQKILDPGFGVETPFYAHDFTVSVPVQLATHLTAGRQVIPVSVRFQTCSGQTCKPPKTVTLSAPINVQAG